jgi:molybdate transport system regulatory protein
MSRSPSFPRIHVRISLGPGAAFGPGKADLLEKIAESGSISAAARQMRMSYKRAWQLVDDMNRSFSTPLVNTTAGGAHGGGAKITERGRRVAKTYRKLQDKIELAATPELAALAKDSADS